jgi:hypothetical protein
MVMLEDFTALSPGRDVPLEGRIDRCPECGRNGGVPHDEPDGTFYVHRPGLRAPFRRDADRAPRFLPTPATLSFRGA